MSNVKYIKNYVQELELENCILRQLTEMFFIYEDKGGNGWVQFGHPEMLDGAALRVDPQCRSGKVIMRYGEILKRVKDNLVPRKSYSPTKNPCPDFMRW